MQSMVITASGGPEVFKLESRSRPEISATEILVKIKATAVNRADVLQRKGQYPAPPGVPHDVPGLEYAGLVEEVGSAVGNFRVGDRVFGLAAGGTYQQYAAIESITAMHIPDHLSWIEAAAIPEAYITAFDAISLQADLVAGEILLVSAAASGVGIAAAQIARALKVKAIGTVRKQGKAEKLKQYFDHVLTVEDGHFAHSVNELTGGAEEGGANVVLELVGGKYVEEDLKCTRRKGRIMVVGLLAGRECNFNLGLLLSKRITVKGTSLRARSKEEKASVTRAFEERILPFFADGTLKPEIEKVFPLAEAAAAHKLMEEDLNFGKIVLEVED